MIKQNGHNIPKEEKNERQEIEFEKKKKLNKGMKSFHLYEKVGVFFFLKRRLKEQSQKNG